MDTEEIYYFFGCITLCIFFGIILGYFARGDALKQQCAKDNNVYECVIVAVPKEGE